MTGNHILGRILRRGDWIDRLVAQAIEEQAKFESEHPVAYALDQRITAVIQRARIIARSHGAKVIPEAAIQARVHEAVVETAPPVKPEGEATK